VSEPREAPLTAIGLMSGTSFDGVDAALVVTDGGRVERFGAAALEPYDDAFRDRLRPLLGRRPGSGSAAIGRELTLRHVEAVRRLMATEGLTAADVDVVGFHGQTVLHRPDRRETWQLGDGQLLADSLGIPVVFQFRAADIAVGGQGAPLAPLYHVALTAGMPRPLAVLNVGGVANVTWIGPGNDEDGAVLAFDTGPGNALLDDWTRTHTGQPVDAGGRLAATGRIDDAVVKKLLAAPFFAERPPKSLDRDDFRRVVRRLDGMAAADGAATLTAFTARAVAAARDFLPAAPRRWLVCGGGRHNATLMAMLAEVLGVPVDPAEDVGWQGDVLEAQAFAFLAVRSLRGLPLSLPTTTGVPAPQTGGVLYRPRNEAERSIEATGVDARVRTARTG